MPPRRGGGDGGGAGAESFCLKIPLLETEGGRRLSHLNDPWIPWRFLGSAAPWGPVGALRRRALPGRVGLRTEFRETAGARPGRVGGPEGWFLTSNLPVTCEAPAPPREGQGWERLSWE